MARNQLIFARLNLYALKRRYGTRATLYHVTDHVTNVQTGRATITRTKIALKKVIQLPTTFQRQLLLDQGYHRVAAVGSPPSGFDLSTKLAIMDKRDLPTGFEFGLQDYLVINHQRFNIKSATELEDNYNTLLTLTTVAGQPRSEVFEVGATSTIALTQQAVTA